MDKNTISQLKQLKQIKPDRTWKINNKEILMSQVANSSTEIKSGNFFIYIKEVFSENNLKIKQSAYGLALLVLLMLGGGFFSMSAASEVTPGSFLYTAKLVGEKTQFAFTPNQESKLKLGVKFAQRRAQEIESLAVINEHNEISDVADSLTAEIIAVNERLISIEKDDAELALSLAKEVDNKTNELRIALKRSKGYLTESSMAVSNKIDQALRSVESANLNALNTIINGTEINDKLSENDISNRLANKLQNTKEKIDEVKDANEFFVANLGKQKQGIEVYNPTKETEQKTKEANKAIKEAEQLLDKDNYEEALEKINESDELLNEISDTIIENQNAEIGTSTPQVKGVIEQETEKLIETNRN